MTPIKLIYKTQIRLTDTKANLWSPKGKEKKREE